MIKKVLEKVFDVGLVTILVAMVVYVAYEYIDIIRAIVPDFISSRLVLALVAMCACFFVGLKLVNLPDHNSDNVKEQRDQEYLD